MSETKFTPGPWRSVIHPDDASKNAYEIACIPHPDVDAIDIVVTSPRNGWGTPEQHECNAYLIAAAPDLYEALEDLRSSLIVLMKSSDLTEELKQADAALAKARGET